LACRLHPSALYAVPEERLVQTSDADQSPVERANDEHGRTDIDEIHHYLRI
jgi:hypothetical protein